MSYSLKFEHPQFPEGHKFSINYLGQVVNGGSVDIDEEAERAFIANNGKTVEDAFANDALVTVSGSSALQQDEVNQLIAQATPEPRELPEATNPANNPAANTATEDDPNALIMGGGENANG